MGSTARYHQFFKFVNITTGKTYLIDELAGSLSDAAQNIDELKEKLSKITSAYVYHGSVANKADLPTIAENGWVYNVESDGMNYAWNAEANEWDALGPTIDLTPYATLENLSDHASLSANTNTLGHVKISYNGIIPNSSAPVGVISNGQLAVPPATLNRYGAVKKSSEHGTNLSVIGMNDSGQLTLNVRSSHSGFEKTDSGELFMNTGSDEHPTHGSVAPVITDTAGKLGVLNASTSQLGGVKIASTISTTGNNVVPNATTVKSYVEDSLSPILTSIDELEEDISTKYQDFTEYKTLNNNNIDRIENSIETNYESLTSLVDTTSSSLLTSLASYQQTTEDNLYVLSSAITGNYTSLYTTVTSVSSDFKNTIDILSQTVEDNSTTLENTLISLSASVYNKDEINEKFKNNKGYIILRDYNTIS